MDAVTTNIRSTSDAEFASRLVDMQELDWQQAMTEHQVLLRLASPSPEMLKALQARFELDELHIIDICNPIHPPHFTRLENDVLHIILRFPVDTNIEDEASAITSVSILLDDNLCALIWPVKRSHRFHSKDLLGLNVHECAGKMIHILVDYLLSRVYKLREDMDELEEECLSDVSNADLVGLLAMRKEMATLARHARNNALVIEQLMADKALMDDVRLVDAHEHMNRACAIAESRAEHALNVMQAAQSLLGQRLNEVMTFLAVITVVLTPMGIIAGVFGMNFAQMDVLAHPNGFALSVWGMLVLGTVLALFFKLKKWW